MLRFAKRHALVVGVVLLLAASAVTPAVAHAVLVSSDPPANGVLDKAPEQVSLFFSEDIENGLSTVEVLDSSGASVTAGAAIVDPGDATLMTVKLNALPDGVYTVIYNAFSSDDGHTETGSFSFAVGRESAAELAQSPGGTTQASTARLPVAGVIAKWLMLVSLALLVGQFSFELLVWKPALAAGGLGFEGPAESPRLWNLLANIALAGLVAGMGLSLLSEAGQAAGRALALPWSDETLQVLGATRLGTIWLVGAGLTLIEVALLKSTPAIWKRRTAFLVGLGILLTLSLTAHASAAAHPTLPVLSDWLHMIGTCFWLGGLPYLFAGLGTLRGVVANGRQLNIVLVERFSAMAMFSVAAIGLTGLYAAFLRVGTLPALLSTIYGRVLLLKQVFVALLLIVAAVNFLWLTPRLRSRAGGGEVSLRSGDQLRKTVVLDMILGGLLLLSVGALTYLPPANNRPPFEIRRTVTARDVKMTIDITPGLVGQDSFTLHLVSLDPTAPPVNAALLRFNAVDHDVPIVEVPLQPVGNGDYTVAGSYLSFTGRWQVQGVAQREGRLDAIAYFNFTLPESPAKQNPAAASQLAAGLIGLDGLLLVLALWVLVQEKGSAPEVS